MFNKKYNEAMRFIDDEIKFYEASFNNYLALADTEAKAGESNKNELREANRMSERLYALRELRLRLISRVGPY